MNEHIHVDGDAVSIYGHRLTLDEARAAAGDLGAAIDQIDTARRVALEKEREVDFRADLFARGWEESADPAVLVRLVPGCAMDAMVVVLLLYPTSIAHRPVPVRVYGGRQAHIATGAPYCECGACVHSATVLPDNHGLPMCRAHRGES